MPRRMSAANRDKIMELLRADPTAIGPQLGLMSMKYCIPPTSYAQLLDVSVPTVYAWFYGESVPRDSVIKLVNRLLVIMRRALLAHEFPLEGTHDERVELMRAVVRKYAPFGRAS